MAVVLSHSVPLLVISLVFLSRFVSSVNGSLSRADLDKKYKIKFRDGADSEKDLEECQDRYTPCSVIQNPFFFPFIIKRLCRCKRKGCPDTFQVKRSLDTVFITSREQLKFCNELPKCHGGWSILHVGAGDDLPYHLNCYCPARRRYWRPLSIAESLDSMEDESSHHEHAHQAHEVDKVEKSVRFQQAEYVESTVTAIPTKLFKCERMEPCQEDRVCGALRTDLFATYQNCTCPLSSVCLPNSRVTTINEVMLSHVNGRFSTCTRLPSSKKEAFTG